jgi:hypothetical protein
MDESFKESIITTIQATNNKEEMFKVLYSSMEKLYETEVNNLIQFSGGKNFYYYDRYHCYTDRVTSESDNENKEDIIAIPKQFGLLAYLIKEEIQKGNIVIMDCESCSAFTADDINGYLENGKKKLLISNPR